MPETETRTRPLPLIAICLGYFMVILDATAVNLSLPALGRDLGGGLGVLQWVIDGYTLTFAALLLSAGALGDRLGARRVFSAGLTLFVVASAACGLAPNIAILIVARLVQGAGAAILVPSSLALLQASHPDRRARARAVGIWGGIAGGAAALGPIVGGVLTQAVSWRLVFFINVPIGLAALALTFRHVVRPQANPGRGLDAAAQFAMVGALGLLTFGLIEARTRGWTSPVILGVFAVAALLGVAFVRIERRSPDPMLPLGLFGDRAFSAGNAVGLLINLGFYGQLFVLSLYFQNVRHLSPVMAGLALLPEGAMPVIASTLSGRVSGRTGTRPVMLTGLCLGAAGLAGLAVAGEHGPYLLLVVPLMAAGFGMAFTMPAATTTVVEAAPAERAGVASGAMNAGRQMGSTIGVALLGTLAGGGLRGAMVVAMLAFLFGAAIVAFAMKPQAGKAYLSD
jgi:MFS transporter, DHA2 family, methylenomycin A resistance protein